MNWTRALQEFERRRLKILRDYNAGMGLVDLSRKYGVTTQRIHAVLQKEKYKPRNCA